LIGRRRLERGRKLGKNQVGGKKTLKERTQGRQEKFVIEGEKTKPSPEKIEGKTRKQAR